MNYLTMLPSTSTYSIIAPSFPSDRTCSFPLSNCEFSRWIVLNGTTLLTISKLGSWKTSSLTPSSGLEEVIVFSGSFGRRYLRKSHNWWSICSYRALFRSNFNHSVLELELIQFELPYDCYHLLRHTRL